MTGLYQKLPELDLTRPLTLYRLCRTEYADLSGYGAARFPGRWNRQGQRAVYTATTASLALSETIVHLPRHSKPGDYSLITIVLQPNSDIVLRQTLDDGRIWFERFGKALTESPEDPIAFAVPSVIVPEYNVVLYPRPMQFEPEFAQIQSIDLFEFDPRLWPVPD